MEFIDQLNFRSSFSVTTTILLCRQKTFAQTHNTFFGAFSGKNTQMAPIYFEIFIFSILSRWESVSVLRRWTIFGLVENDYAKNLMALTRPVFSHTNKYFKYVSLQFNGTLCQLFSRKTKVVGKKRNTFSNDKKQSKQEFAEFLCSKTPFFNHSHTTA